MPSTARALLTAPGYVGRNLAKHIHDNRLASDMRIVDKHLPELAWLAPEFKEACSRERFMQADAAQESALHTCIHRTPGAPLTRPRVPPAHLRPSGRRPV